MRRKLHLLSPVQKWRVHRCTSPGLLDHMGSLGHRDQPSSPLSSSSPAPSPGLGPTLAVLWLCQPRSPGHAGHPELLCPSPAVSPGSADSDSPLLGISHPDHTLALCPAPAQQAVSAQAQHVGRDICTCQQAGGVWGTVWSLSWHLVLLDVSLGAGCGGLARTCSPSLVGVKGSCLLQTHQQNPGEDQSEDGASQMATMCGLLPGWGLIFIVRGFVSCCAALQGDPQSC